MVTMKNDNGKKLIVGFGSALVDILVHEDDAFLQKTGAVKGGMTLVDQDFIERVLSLTSKKLSIVPGGSACNTVVGIGKLGGIARFVGKLGKDELGDLFRTKLTKNNVEPFLFPSPLPTGRVLSIITPDAQRSMFTFLGASSETQPEEIQNTCFDNAAIVHMEGYLLFSKDLILTALKTAKEAGALISLDLASFTVVEESKEFLEKNVMDDVDIVIANEDEARAFTGCSNDIKAIEALSEKADIAVLKVGERGSFISRAGRIIEVKPMGTGSVIDTTGAGDLWAAGFLFGLVNGFSMEKCGELGSACGYEVCRVVGASIPDDSWQKIKKRVSRSRKRQLEQPDEFITFSQRLIEFVAKHRTQLSYALGVLAVLIIAIVGVLYFSNKAESRAFALLDQGMAKYKTAIQNKTPGEAYLEVKQDFQTILEKYSGKDAEKFARVFCADICYKADDFDKAIEMYNKALQDFENNPFFKNIILRGLGHSFIEKKDYTNAAKYFEMLAAGPDAIMKDEALFNLGELYATLGNKDKSRDSFKKILSDYSDSMYVEIVKEKLVN